MGLGTFIMLATYGLFYLMTARILSFTIGDTDTGGPATGTGRCSSSR